MKLAAHITLALTLAMMLVSCADEGLVIRESIIIINLDDDDWDEDDWYVEPECIEVFGSWVCPDVSDAASDGADTDEDDSGDEDKPTE
ncbi:MAG: hypothetical protein OXT74_01965 [Candidatus Poribacteria bacterium]|nr:hypothetical protein [Candidatus Poribacteria bacterium]